MVNLHKGVVNIIPGIYEFRASWRVEAGGMFRRTTIDLDALCMVANEGKRWVGAAHKKDKAPFNGLLRYGGDAKAKSGGKASESIFFDLAGLINDNNARHGIFAVTSFGNPLSALGKTAELRFDLFAPDDVRREHSLLKEGMRDIESDASAALALQLDFSTGEFLEIDDLYQEAVRPEATAWRQLTGAASQVLNRPIA